MRIMIISFLSLIHYLSHASLPAKSELSGPKELLASLCTGLANEDLNELKAIVENQKEQVSSLQAEIRELNLKIKELDINRSEVSFKFELTGVSDFFKFNGNRRSNIFWCQGLQWSIGVNTEMHHNLKYLNVHLHCHNDEQLSWSCDTEFDLILFGDSAENPNLVRKTYHTFQRREGFGFGCFIGELELLHRKLKAELSHIKNNTRGTIDTIVLGVELKALPVVRKG